MRRRRRRNGRRILAFCLLTTLLAGVGASAIHLRPILTSMATTRVSNAVSREVSAAVNDSIINGTIAYDKLMTLERDNEGEVVAVKSNMAEFSRLQALILGDIYQRIAEISTKEISIPIGTLTGFPLLVGRGPFLRVWIQSVGTASAAFENTFTSAGINQTKHQIVLHINVAVSIFLPGSVTSTKVSNQYTVAETIIVGSVPESYTYFGLDEQDVQDYMLNQG